MSDQFYITLPSNTEKDSTASNFRVTMPQRIKLDGSWEVGLAEIIYPNSWYNLTEANDNNVIKLGIQLHPHDSVIVKKIYIPADYYKTVEHLLFVVSNCLAKELEAPYTDAFMISYFDLPKITVVVDLEYIRYVSIGEELANLLGFEKKFYSFLEHGKTDEIIAFDNDENSVASLQYRARRHNFKNSAIPTMYVYCNIVEDQIIGNTVAPLLRIVDVQGEHGDIINRMYDYPHFIPLLVKDISSIEINIKDDMDQFITFAFGKVVVKLVFRKCSHYFD